MITVYVCDTKDCPNEAIDYNVEDAPAVVVCGGCHKVLAPKVEGK